MTPEKTVIIIGGGVSGLSAAYYLGRAGIRCTILEKAPRTGGLIRTDRTHGCLLEAGPDSFIATKPAVSELAAEMGDLQQQIIGSNDARRRIFVVRRGRLVPLPPGMVMMVPTEWRHLLTSSLLGLRTKMTILTEQFASPRLRSEDVSVAEFVRDHFGQEAVDYLTEPLLTGVYGGDVAALSATSVLPRFVDYERTYGSLVKGVRQEHRARPKSGSLFLSFRDGMQSLTDHLAQRLEPCVRTVQAEAISVERSGNRWIVRTATGSESASDVILACPAHVSAILVEGAAPGLGASLASIPYSSAILTTFVYRRVDLNNPLDGFGFLVPQRERRTIAAATWVSTKFPNRTPSDVAAIRTFIVGAQAATLGDVDQPTIASLAAKDLAEMMGVRAEPVFTGVQRWPKSMPQYVVGHSTNIASIRAALTHTPGLHLIGNAYDGVGIPDCIRLAKETAKAIAEAKFAPAAL